MGRSISAVNVKTRDVTQIEWYIRDSCEELSFLCIDSAPDKVRDSCVARGSENTWNPLIVFISNIKLSSRIQLPRGLANDCLLTSYSGF